MSRLKNLNKLLPFVAIGTIADCQSVLEPTNRLLVRAGLQMMQQQKFENAGLLELMKQTGTLEKMQSGHKLTSQDLGFVFSPILNASGRVSHAKLSISTLLAQEPEAGVLASELIAANQERKQMVKDILVEVDAQSLEQIQNKASIIWLEGAWSKGIVGLIASRLVNQYNVPVIVVAIEADHGSGSLRAPEGYHLPNAMNRMIELFDKCGGHPCAAGFSCETNNLEQIRNGFEVFLAEQKNQMTKTSDNRYTTELTENLPLVFQDLVTDYKTIWLDESDLTSETLLDLWLLDPFGQDFPFPTFVFKCTLFKVRFMGQLQQHFKITLPTGIPLTAFNIDLALQKDLLDNKQINVWVQAKLSQNSWNGVTKQELIAERIIPHSTFPNNSTQ